MGEFDSSLGPDLSANALAFIARLRSFGTRGRYPQTGKRIEQVQKHLREISVLTKG